MTDNKNRVCPVERSGSLESRLRRLIQNPGRMLGPYIEKGMTVLDVGCGPGFFTLEMAQMVGEAGRVIAVDLQEGMLEKLRAKIEGTQLEGRITPQRCGEDRIGVTEPVDFALAFYMVHEVPDQTGFFKEMESILNPDGRILVVEPPYRVSKAAFEKTVSKAQETGLALIGRPKVFLGRTALFAKGSPEVGVPREARASGSAQSRERRLA
jgi:ubiquinone/menaquinone biosynthesis C-methylase UbiE